MWAAVLSRTRAGSRLFPLARFFRTVLENIPGISWVLVISDFVANFRKLVGVFERRGIFCFSFRDFLGF